MPDVTITAAQRAELRVLIDIDDRTGFYAKLYQYTGREAAFLMGQLSRGSDINGGVAYRINAQIEKYAPRMGDEYPPGGIVPFSKDVAAHDLSLIAEKPGQPGVYKVPTDLEMLRGAHDVWVSKGLGDYFPGNGKIAREYLLQGDISGYGDFMRSIKNPLIAGFVDDVVVIDGAYEIVAQGLTGASDYGAKIDALLNAHPLWTTSTFERDGHSTIQVIDENGITQGLFRPPQNLIDWNLFHGSTVDGIADQLAELSISASSTIVAGTGGVGDEDAAKAAHNRAQIVDFWTTTLTEEWGLSSVDDLEGVAIYQNSDGSVFPQAYL
jgi:hypothetical protein